MGRNEAVTRGVPARNEGQRLALRRVPKHQRRRGNGQGAALHDRGSDPVSKDKAIKKTKSENKSAKKSRESVRAQAVSDITELGATAFDDVAPEEIGEANMNAADRQLLGRVVRFLYTITAPTFLRRALRAGYGREEHEALWQLFTRAAGRDQSLETSFGLAGTEVGSSERQHLLLEIDAFENLWFPRTRAIIARVVPQANVEQFQQAFFRDLSQQPFGPLVLDSVSTFLSRVAGLEGSEQPGARAVLDTLQRRGLTEAVRSDMSAKIGRARLGAVGASPRVNTEALQSAVNAQQQALRELRLAWADWSTTLRTLYDVREQVQLGLTEVRVRTASEPAVIPEATPVPGAPALPQVG